MSRPLAPHTNDNTEEKYRNLPAGPITLELPGHAGYAAWGIDAAGRAFRLPVGPGPGLTLAVDLTGGPAASGGAFMRYVLAPAGGAP